VEKEFSATWMVSGYSNVSQEFIDARLEAMEREVLHRAIKSVPPSWVTVKLERSERHLMEGYRPGILYEVRVLLMHVIERPPVFLATPSPLHLDRINPPDFADRVADKIRQAERWMKRVLRRGK